MDILIYNLNKLKAGAQCESYEIYLFFQVQDSNYDMYVLVSTNISVKLIF